jgi:HNH endonuclease
VIELAGSPWRRIILSSRHDIWCLVDADDYDWLISTPWNYGWHRTTPWKFYAKRNIGAARSTVYLHREVLIRALPDQAELAATHHGDHVNGNSLDNRRSNLRWLTPAQNAVQRIPRARVPTLDQIVQRLSARAPVLEEAPF